MDILNPKSKGEKPMYEMAVIMRVEAENDTEAKGISERIKDKLADEPIKGYCARTTNLIDCLTAAEIEDTFTP